MDSASTTKSGEITTVTVDKEHEFRFQVEYDSSVTIKLLTGTAECFGTELAPERPYTFKGVMSAIFTWHGCTLEINGSCHSYIGGETPMISYFNVHNAIEGKRISVASTRESGPRVILVGPTDSGKTSISKILLNYAARKGHMPVFVDLDVGQNSITIPGVLAAVSIDRPFPLESHDPPGLPLAFYYGHLSPAENLKLYKLLLGNLARDINRKFERNDKARTSGMIVNTCGWVDAQGYELIKFTIETLSADLVLVLDNEKIFSDLNKEYSSKNIRVVKLPKSGGVVTRERSYRITARTKRIKSYFYGDLGDLCPHSTVANFSDFVIYKVGGGPAAPQSALPIGAESKQDNIKLVAIHPSPDLVHSVLAVSHSRTAEGVLDSNVAGFIVVTDINMERQKITFLAPSPGPLPSKYFLAGSLKYLE